MVATIPFLSLLFASFFFLFFLFFQISSLPESYMLEWWLSSRGGCRGSLVVDTPPEGSFEIMVLSSINAGVSGEQ